MAQDLDEYLKTHPPKGFRPVPHYFAQGDFVTFYFRNDPCFAQRVDDLLTVFVAFDTRELVGCKIKGVKHILQTAGEFGVTVDGGDIQLGFSSGLLSPRTKTKRSAMKNLVAWPAQPRLTSGNCKKPTDFPAQNPRLFTTTFCSGSPLTK